METDRFTLKGFQRNMLTRFIVIAAIGGIVTTLLFYVITKRRLDEVLYTPHLPRSIYDFLLPYVITANLIGLLIVIIALILTMRATFWKVAGPLFRISQDIQKMIDGDHTVNIRLRKDDEFKDIAEDFDLMRKSIGGRFRKIKEHCAELSNTAADMWLCYDDKELLKGENTQLGKNIEELREGLDEFKI